LAATIAENAIRLLGNAHVVPVEHIDLNNFQVKETSGCRSPFPHRAMLYSGLVDFSNSANIPRPINQSVECSQVVNADVAWIVPMKSDIGF
jgi:hypothetical protein